MITCRQEKLPFIPYSDGLFRCDEYCALDDVRFFVESYNYCSVRFISASLFIWYGLRADAGFCYDRTTGELTAVVLDRSESRFKAGTRIGNIAFSYEELQSLMYGIREIGDTFNYYVQNLQSSKDTGAVWNFRRNAICIQSVLPEQSPAPAILSFVVSLENMDYGFSAN